MMFIDLVEKLHEVLKEIARGRPKGITVTQLYLYEVKYKDQLLARIEQDPLTGDIQTSKYYNYGDLPTPEPKA
jgi:hypothetical protein